MWYDDNAGSKAHPVGKKKPNPYGLYDMHGNVWEWVQDKYHSDYYVAPTDGSAWESGDGADRVIRGGGWYYIAGFCRSASQVHDSPSSCTYDLGFRLLEETQPLSTVPLYHLHVTTTERLPGGAGATYTHRRAGAENP